MSFLLRRLGPVLAALVPLLLTGCGDDDVAVTVEPTVQTPGTGDAPEPDEPPPADAAEVEETMARMVFELVNDERRERGLDPLQRDEQLAEHARRWSRQMADEGRLEHQDPQRMLERAEGFSGVGENIFRGAGPVPASTVHVGWMRSDGHRANVLRPGFDRIGIGFVCTDDGQVWATQRFGRSGAPPRSAPDRDVPSQEPIVASEGEGPTCPGAAGSVEVELPGR